MTKSADFCHGGEAVHFLASLANLSLAAGVQPAGPRGIGCGRRYHGGKRHFGRARSRENEPSGRKFKNFSRTANKNPLPPITTSGAIKLAPRSSGSIDHAGGGPHLST
jgi:hypothetical protein